MPLPLIDWSRFRRCVVRGGEPRNAYQTYSTRSRKRGRPCRGREGRERGVPRRGGRHASRRLCSRVIASDRLARVVVAAPPPHASARGAMLRSAASSEPASARTWVSTGPVRCVERGRQRARADRRTIALPVEHQGRARGAVGEALLRSGVLPCSRTRTRRRDGGSEVGEQRHLVRHGRTHWPTVDDPAAGRRRARRGGGSAVSIAIGARARPRRVAPKRNAPGRGPRQAVARDSTSVRDDRGARGPPAHVSGTCIDMSVEPFHVVGGPRPAVRAGPRPLCYLPVAHLATRTTVYTPLPTAHLIPIAAGLSVRALRRRRAGRHTPFKIA